MQQARILPLLAIIAAFAGCARNRYEVELEYAGHRWTHEAFSPEVYSNWADAKLARAYLLFGEERFQESLECFQSLRGSKNAADASAMCGLIWAKWRLISFAEPELRQAIASAPNRPWPRIVLALALADSERFKDAEDVAVKCTAISNSQEAWETLSEVRAQARSAEAKQTLCPVLAILGLVFLAVPVTVIFTANLAEIVNEIIDTTRQVAAQQRELGQAVTHTQNHRVDHRYRQDRRGWTRLLTEFFSRQVRCRESLRKQRDLASAILRAYDDYQMGIAGIPSEAESESRELLEARLSRRFVATLDDIDSIGGILGCNRRDAATNP